MLHLNILNAVIGNKLRFFTKQEVSCQRQCVKKERKENRILPNQSISVKNVVHLSKRKNKYANPGTFKEKAINQ